MCANPAVPTDNHAAADNRARTDPTTRSYLCSGLNHRQRPDLRRRIDARPPLRQLRTDEYREKLVARDRRVRQRAPTPRMVRWSGSPLSQRALALPYQDARSQRRPMSDRVPTHNADCPENSLLSGQPFAEGPHLQGAVRVHPHPRAPCSQQLQVDMAPFGERTLRYPKLLQPSAFPASEPSSASVSLARGTKKGREGGHCSLVKR